MSIGLKLPAPLAFKKSLSGTIENLCNKLEEAVFFLKATKGLLTPPNFGNLDISGQFQLLIILSNQEINVCFNFFQKELEYN